MGIVDEKGRLFGKINVIDLAVVIGVAVVVLAAARFLLIGGAPTTVYVQVEAEGLPAGQADAFEEGATLDGGRITVTDVRRVAVDPPTRRVFAKLEVPAETVGGSFRYDQTILQPDHSFGLEVDGSVVIGRIVLVDQNPDLVYLQPPTPVLFVGRGLITAPGADVRSEIGRFDDHHLVEIRDTTVAPGFNRTSIYIEGRLFRLSGTGEQTPDEPVVPGTSRTLTVPQSRIAGEVLAVGESGVDISTDTVSATVRVTNRTTPTLDTGSALPWDGPGSIRVGDRDVRRDVPLATVQDVVLLDGKSVQPGRPPAKARAHVDLDLRTIHLGGPPIYRGRPLVPGTMLRFQGNASFRGEVVAVAAPTPRETPTDVTLTVPSVPPWVADAIRSGAGETTAAGRPLMSVDAVRSDPATVIVETDDGDVVAADHPRLRDLTVNATLHVPPQGTWKGRPVEPGVELFVQPDGIPLRAEIVEVAG